MCSSDSCQQNPASFRNPEDLAAASLRPPVRGGLLIAASCLAVGVGGGLLLGSYAGVRAESPLNGAKAIAPSGTPEEMIGETNRGASGESEAYAFAPRADAPSPTDVGVFPLKGKFTPSVEKVRDALKLPPLPEGVTDLRFSEFFKPIGDRGLEYTDKIKSLDGKKVRLLGFMVSCCSHTPGMFLLTSIPVTTHDHEMGLCDDLPGAVVHVFMPDSPIAEGGTPRARRLAIVPPGHQLGQLLPGAVPWTPGLLLLTGTLSIGNREEADGRLSVARLQLDPLPPGSPVSWKPEELAESRQ